MAPDTRRESTGLVIVGASVGGLAAAILAADRGLRVVVLEREREAGGGAAGEPENIAAAGTRFQRIAGVKDDAGRFTADLLAAAGGPLDSETVHALAAESAAVVEWLADRGGVGLVLASEAAHGHGAPRLHAPDRGGTGLVASLARVAGHVSRISLRPGVMVDELLRDEQGAVTGVSAHSGRRVSQPLAGPVLLACGGFAADPTLVGTHCPDVADLPYHGWTGATGEGLRLGTTVDARTRSMSAVDVTPFLVLPGHLAVTAPVAELGALLVDQAGRRFTDERSDRLTLARAIRRCPGGVAYLVFDDRIAGAARQADPFFATTVLPRAGRRAETLEDLARQYELGTEALETSVASHVAAATAAGRPPLAAPFHAIRVTGARRRMLGGLAVDARARVLGADGQPVAGLYATGGAAAGLAAEGARTAMPGTVALAALGFARIAALQVMGGVPEPEVAE